MDYSLGVDLGTTFVTAAIASAARVEMFTLGDHSIAVPAAVYLREDGTLVTGEAAGLRAMRSPDRVSREFKRLLGNPSPVILGGQPHTVTSLLGALLRDVLHKVAETQGQLPDRIALTHPASWGPFHRARFDEVPRYAGLHNPPMVTEPEAAATHYASSRLLTDGETVAVYDLGGATFEATVLRKVPGGTEILGIPERIEQLGGATFDEAILSYIDYAADGAVSELNMRDSQTGPALARLRQNCILAKEALSVDAETILPVFLPSRHFDVRLTRSRFENMVQKQIESTIAALSRTLDSAQVKRSDLSAVLLVGGSSRIPLVAQMLSAELGRPTVVDTHPEHAIALGAATFAAQAPVPPAGIVLGTGHQQRNAQPSRSAESPTHAATPRDTTSHDTIVSPRPRTTQTDPRPEAPMAPTNTVLGTGHQQRNAQPSRSAESPIHAATPRNTTPRDTIVSPRPRTTQTDQWSASPQTPLNGRVSTTDGRQRRFWLLLTTAAALVIAIAVTAFVLLRSNIDTRTNEAMLMLSTPQVQIGDTYSATASGFASGENLKISWTGPTDGLLGVLPTGPDGSASNQVFERDPPGNYIFTVKGLTSGRTASAGLQVVTGTGPDAARLMLSKPQVAIGDTYFATAWGFSSGEEVRFSWTGPTNGVMGVFSTDSAGSKSHGPVLEADPPGIYIITVTGLTSGRRATAELKVL